VFQLILKTSRIIVSVSVSSSRISIIDLFIFPGVTLFADFF
jgi:hypothetical protein